MRIGITGGAGFVGTNLIRQLLEKNHQLRVIDNFCKDTRHYLSDLDVEIIESDICDYEQIRNSLKDVETVIHLAAAGSVVESVKQPQFNFEANTLGTFNVLRAARECQVRRVVFSSTGGALMGNTPPPVNERSLPKPISPYGASKLCCEAYLNAFHESYGIETVSLRFANVYGPYSGHKTGVINKFYGAIKQGQAVTIFGDGTSTRDYIHVKDLCCGIILAVENSILSNEIFHIATGRETSLKELAEIFFQIFEIPNPRINFMPQRTGEVERNFANFDYANEVLGYMPKIKLEDGLKETVQWMENSNL